MTAVSPLAGKTDLFTFTITAAGATIPDTYNVARIQVHKQVNGIPYATLLIRDGDPYSEAFAISAAGTFVPGAAITISAGYHEENRQIFKGLVIKHAILADKKGDAFLELTCYDEALKLTCGRKSAYSGKNDAVTIRQLISAAGLAADVDSTAALHDEQVRYYASDWDFIVCRAEANGRIVTVEDGKVAVKAPQINAEPGLLIKYGDALYTLNAEIDARYQLPGAESSAWDFATQQVVRTTADEPAMPPQGNLSAQNLAKVLGASPYATQTAAPLPKEELKTWADAQLLKSRMAKIRGTVGFIGNATAKPGQTIQLDGVGARFNGIAFIFAVTHTIADGDWQTEVSLGLSPHWFVEQTPQLTAPLNSGLRPGINGLHIGKVKQIDKDPDNQIRILVEAPLIAPNGNGVWARLASPYAGDKVGMYFIPEIGDEVVLGFLNDDPGFPIILGSLYSTSRPPPIGGDTSIPCKTIVSKTRLEISMDDTRKELHLKTPGGQEITLSDSGNSVEIKDSNNNKISLSTTGISLTSATNINITAKGNINIEAQGGNLAMKAAATLTQSALSINATADTQLNMQGNAGTELTSSGMLKLRGALVTIN